MLQAKAWKAGGSTALYDSVAHASQSFLNPSFGDVLYLITDGMDASSSWGDSQAEFALARAGIRTLVVLLPISGGRMSSARAQAESWARGVTGATGGAVFHADQWKDNTEVLKRLDAFQSLVTHGYRLELAFPRKVDKPREWNLQITDLTGRKAKNIQVVYPRLVVPLSDK